MQIGVMEIAMIVQAILYLGALLFGFAITWGKIKRITEDHERRIKSQEDKLTQPNGSTAYVTPNDCKEHRKERDKEITNIKQYLNEHRHKMDSLMADMSAVKAKLKVNKRATNGQS